MNPAGVEPFTFRCHRTIPIMAIIWSLCAVLLAAFGLVPNGDQGFLWSALIPASWAVALFLIQSRAIEGSITAEGIELLEPREIVEFRNIIGIKAFKRDLNKPHKDYRIRIHHSGGVLTIPATADC